MHNKILITYSDLRKIELNQEVEVDLLNFICGEGETITMTKIISDEFSQNFRVEMSKNCKWDTHFHDCEEVIVMYEGVLYNNTSNERIDRLKQLKIDPYTDHSIVALEDSIFYVEFKKPQI